MKKIKKYKRKIISSVISVSFSICTFIYCLLGFSTPVFADTTYYWDGQYCNLYSETPTLNNDVYLANTGQRALFFINPTGSHYVSNWAGDTRLIYYWYLGNSPDSNIATTLCNRFKYSRDVFGIYQSISAASNIIDTSTNITANNIATLSYKFGDNYYAFGYYSISPKVCALNAGKRIYVSKGTGGFNTEMLNESIFADAGFGDWEQLDSNSYVGSNTSARSITYRNNDLSETYYLSNCGQNILNYNHPLYADFKPSVISLFTNGDVPITSTSGEIYYPYGDGSGSGGDDGNGGSGGDGGNSAGGTMTGQQQQQQQMQQQQQIAEGAVTNSQTISPNAINNTVTVNSGSGGSGSDQTVSGLEQAATGGWFDNLESAFSGVNQMINQLKNMPKLITGLFAFLPNELLNAITIMFGIMIPIVLIKVLV